MVETILKDRLKSLDSYKEKLMEDMKKLSYSDERENVLDYLSHINEALGFLVLYRNELISFLDKGDYSYARYEETMMELDKKFQIILDTLQTKESAVKKDTSL